MSQYTDLLASDEMMRHSHEMVMVPRLWSSCSLQVNLSWSVYPFSENSRSQIPEQQGIYAFLILPGIAGDLNVAYLMYIGETDRTLRVRFGEYLLEARSDKIRPKLRVHTQKEIEQAFVRRNFYPFPCLFDSFVIVEECVRD